MVKRLAKMDLVIYEPYQGVTLTETGRKIALQVLRSHRLVELYLVEMLAIPWDQVHEEADKWEHVLSQKLADRMDTILGYPTQDPHGAPIPKQDGTISQPDYISLLELEVGQSAAVAEVNDRNPDLLRYLAQLGLQPDAQVTLVEVAPFEGLLILCIDEKTHIVGRKVAQKISLINPATLHAYDKERKTL